MPTNRSSDGNNNPGDQISKIPLNLCRFEIPHWMTEALDNSALTKEASKFSETLHNDRSGRYNENPSAQILKYLLDP